jgi:hypothetical protein
VHLKLSNAVNLNYGGPVVSNATLAGFNHSCYSSGLISWVHTRLTVVTVID